MTAQLSTKEPPEPQKASGATFGERIEAAITDLQSFAELGDGRLVVRGLRQTDATLASIHDGIIRADHELDQNGRALQNDRRRTERLFWSSRTRLQQLVRDRLDKARTAFDRLLDDSTEHARSSLILITNYRTSEFIICVDSESWHNYASWVKARTQVCINDLCHDADASFEEHAAALRNGTATKISCSPPTPPQSIALPTTALPESLDPRFLGSRIIDPPTWGVGLWRHARQNVALVGIIAALIAVVSALNHVDGAATPSTTAILMLAWLPLSILSGVFAVRAHRDRTIRIAMHAQQQSIHSQLRHELTRALDRERRRVEHWISNRSAAWLDTIDSTYDCVVTDYFEQAECSHRLSTLEWKQYMARLTTKLASARTLRNRLASRLDLEFQSGPLASGDASVVG